MKTTSNEVASKYRKLTEQDVRAIPAGACVEWTSQAQGSITTKTGEVVCLVPKKMDLREAATKAGRPLESDNVKCDLVSIAADRVLVKVTTVGKRTTRVDYYAPPVGRLVKNGKRIK